MIQVQKHLEGQLADGRYPLIELLGSTQHSSVFRTECDEAPGRQAAIKLIPAPAAASEAQLTRWRLAARFSHPALLRIFDMGRCDLEGRPMLYVVMELAEENLADVLPVRPLSPDEASGMLAPVLEALAYLHSKGFVHGHLQPSNILAMGDQVKLSTDSIARIGESAEMRDPLDPHRAPEAILSAASDVWSLGIAVVECLTRRTPERQSEEGNAVIVPESMPAPFFDFARHCLHPVPQRRWRLPQLQAALGIKSAASTAPAESSTNATAAPQAAAAASAFVKSNPLPAIRRRLRLKKRHGFILAGVVAAAAAFILGIIISGSGSDNSSTAPAPIAASAKAPLASTPQQALAATAKQPEASVALSKPKLSSEKLRTESEKPAQPKSVHASDASLIVSNVTPAAPAEASPAVTGDVVPGAVTRRALPRVPESASDSIWGTVRVSVIVDVDPRGHVVEAKLDSAGPSQYFARLSMAAAQDWKFAPPHVAGSIVPSEWLINFGYSKADTSATASEKHP
jgi:serine/threonine protein kinase